MIALRLSAQETHPNVSTNATNRTSRRDGTRPTAFRGTGDTGEDRNETDGAGNPLPDSLLGPKKSLFKNRQAYS